ncbi:hypothetical protein OGATHE_003784 [Ogataea polymorpha]|uniref:Uncharacterized protein n=1 Tax=Ogataea polymorpha TaxID=460523 RepID=A0A9P8T476_9ASCO|nr:hypothetical protein OGATHE_003784 [Ogataea polymorpha]
MCSLSVSRSRLNGLAFLSELPNGRACDIGFLSRDENDTDSRGDPPFSESVDAVRELSDWSDRRENRDECELPWRRALESESRREERNLLRKEVPRRLFLGLIGVISGGTGFSLPSRRPWKPLYDGGTPMSPWLLDGRREPLSLSSCTDEVCDVRWVSWFSASDELDGETGFTEGSRDERRDVVGDASGLDSCDLFLRCADDVNASEAPKLSAVYLELNCGIE